jgi:hypothetical protein
MIAVGILGLGALAAYVKYGGASKVPPEVRRIESAQPPAAQKEGERESVELVTPTREGTELKLGKHRSDVPEGEDGRIFAINHFLRESKIVPDNARAIGIQVKDGVALVDVSPSFNQTYGSFDEEALLKGICATLAQFKGIEKVQFFVDGKSVETLGNVDLTEPIPVREAPAASN